MNSPGSLLTAGAVPYEVAQVDLTEGLRAITDVVGCELAEVRPGLPVTLE